MTPITADLQTFDHDAASTIFLDESNLTVNNGI